MDNNKLIILLIGFLTMFLLTIAHPSASEVTEIPSNAIVLNMDGSLSESFTLGNYSERKPIYLSDGTCITYKYLIDNPEFSINVFSPSDTSGSVCLYVDGSFAFKFANYPVGTTFERQDLIISSSSLDHNEKTINEYFSDKDSDFPVCIYRGTTSSYAPCTTWQFNATGIKQPSIFSDLVECIKSVSSSFFDIGDLVVDFVTSNNILLIFLIISIISSGITILIRIYNYI